MKFFNKLGNIANKTYKSASQKTGELAKEAKIKMKMNENKGKIKDLYADIGKIIYQNHINSEDVKQEEIDAYCHQIDNLSKKIEEYQEEILALKNKRICENCYEEIELTSKYCPQCGFEQPEVNKEENIDDKNIIDIVEEEKKED